MKGVSRSIPVFAHALSKDFQKLQEGDAQKLEHCGSLPRNSDVLAANVAAAFAGGTVLAQTLSSAVGAAALLSRAVQSNVLQTQVKEEVYEGNYFKVTERAGEWYILRHEPRELLVRVTVALATYHIYRDGALCATGSLLWGLEDGNSRFARKILAFEGGNEVVCNERTRAAGVRLRYHDAADPDDVVEVTIAVHCDRQDCRVCLTAERTEPGKQAAGAGKPLSLLGWSYVLNEPKGQVVYGLGEFLNQTWPLSDAMLPPTPFVTWDNAPSGVGSVLSPVLLSSTGVAVVMPHPPFDLHVSSNAQVEPAIPHEKFTTDVYIPIYSSVLDAETRRSRQRPHRQCPPVQQPGKTRGDQRLCAWSARAKRLELELLIAAEPRLDQTFSHLRRWFGAPQRSWKSTALIERVIWSTWAEMKADVTATKVMLMADNLRSLDLQGGIIEIDDKWQRNYGDTSFDPNKFPEPRQLVDALHARGFLVTLWIPPFITEESTNFAEARDRGFLLGHGKRPVEWWQGQGHLLNVFKPEARDWWQSKLRQLQHETGIDGFKFDAGEGAFVPSALLRCDALDADAVLQQNEYTRQYVAMASSFPIAEVRTSWFDSLFAPVVVRLFDKSSKWGTDNGLKSVVTGALTVSVLGVQVVMPDMIGGNAYGNADEVALETDPAQLRELYIRWLQASIAMPCVQFSLQPQLFDRLLPPHPELSETVVDLVRRYLRFRETSIVPLLLTLLQNDEPIVRPVCWDERLTADHPLSGVASRVDDEYLIGTDLLVAPVLAYGQRRRSVYLPTGYWCRWRIDSACSTLKSSLSPDNVDINNRDTVWLGPCVITEEAPLHELLLYRRVQPVSDSLPTHALRSETFECNRGAPEEKPRQALKLLQTHSSATSMPGAVDKSAQSGTHW
jgi:hypothetical protein